MAEITVSEVCKSFEQDRPVLDRLSFQVDLGERVALLGDNGAGKTTLFRILAGELSPDSGSVSIPKNRRVGYVRQINTAPENETVENVLRGAYEDVIGAGHALEKMREDMASVRAEEYDEQLRRFESRGGYAWEAEMTRIANGLGIDERMRAQSFSTLSGGEQTRVWLARMIMQEPDILLLDEPTNHLDVSSLEWLEDRLLHYRGTVLVISHDRFFLDTAVQRIVELKDGRAELYGGSYSFYVQEKELRRQRQLLQWRQEQAKVKQLEFQIARLKAWGSVYDNPALHKKAAAMEKRIERVQQTEKPREEQRLRAGFGSEAFRADRVLELKEISKSFDGRRLFGPVSALIRGGGEHVALVGPNGAGKSTLLKILLGQLAPDSGEVVTGPSVRAAYLPQQVTFEYPERTLYDTLLYETACTPQEARDRLGLFRFSGEDQFKRVSQLSGGEKARLKLCILMMDRVNLLILDEPTNHLDLSSREWIEEAVSRFEGTLLFVSHDRYFIRRFADHIWDLEDGFCDYPSCDYDRWRELRRRRAEAEAAERRREKEKTDETKKASPREERSAEKVSKGLSPRTERRMNALEREILKKEEELSAFDKRAEAVASDYLALQQLQREKDALRQEIDSLYAEWEYLSTGGK